MGKLYVVQLYPIDASSVTLRARRIIDQADLIVVSDPAHLSAMQADMPHTVDLRDQDPEDVVGHLQAVLETGDVAWLVPQIAQWSSRETYLLNALLQCGLTVESVPGPSAMISALVSSGLPCVRFSFLGEMPSSAAQRRAALREIESDRNTLVFAVRGANPERVLSDVRSVLGDRQIVLSEAIADGGCAYLVIAGAAGDPLWPEGRVRQELGELFARQLSTRDAVDLVSDRSRWRKRAVYKIALEMMGR
jgi:16S rRNA (cytidine1402-2'-O)-methyltransferase